MVITIANVIFSVVVALMMFEYADATIFEALTASLLALCSFTLSDISRAVRKK